MFTDEVAIWAKTIDHPQVYVYANMRQQRNNSNISKYSSTQNPSQIHKPDYDIPYKRNVALLDARENDYRTICLLDDDITLTNDDFLKAREALITDVDIASFHVLDYPDVSTIDHIERILTQTESRVSIGGNCLFMNTHRIHSFFPEMYNDDWFFIFSHIENRKIVSLGEAKQRIYEPWKDLDRIAFEQCGDIIIEGAKNNIYENRPPFAGDSNYWEKIKRTYLQRLEVLLSLAEGTNFQKPVDHAIQITKSLERV